MSPVAYVDILEGDSEGHVRFKTPEAAQVVLGAQAAVRKEHGWTLDLLAGKNRSVPKCIESDRYPHRSLIYLVLFRFVASQTFITCYFCSWMNEWKM